MSTSVAGTYIINVPSFHIASYQEVVGVDSSQIMPGETLEVQWNGSPVWVYRRTREQLDFIATNYSGADDETVEAIIRHIKGGASSTTGYLSARLQLVDQPDLERLPHRSKKPEYFVFLPVGRLGCQLTEQLPAGADSSEGAWLSDPCFSQVYDLRGQILPGQSAALPWADTLTPAHFDNKIPSRTRIPPHSYLADGTLVIGVADISTTPDIFLPEEELFADLSPTDVLLQATSFNDLERARDAIEAGADVTSSNGTIPNPHVSLALRRAVLSSSTAMVEMLLSNGAVPTDVEIDAAKRMKRHDVSELFEGVSAK